MSMRSAFSRLDSAHVIAGIALFIALSSIAYASVGKNTVKSKHIVNGQVKNADVKKEGLKGNRLKEDTVTGTQVDESTLGEVSDADRVDGHHARAIRYSASASGSTAYTTILDLGHLELQARCTTGPELDVRFESGRDNSTIHINTSVLGNAVDYDENDDFDSGQTASVGPDDSAQTSFSFFSPNTVFPATSGHTISGNFLMEEDAGVDCLVAGNVIGSTPGGLVIAPFRQSQKGADRVEEAEKADSAPQEG